MTPEDLLRRAYDSFNEHGLGDGEDFWHPDVEYHEAADFPGAGTYRGRVEARGDRVAWTVRLSGRSPEGAPHAHTWGYAGRIEDGLVTECRAFYAADEAYEALEGAG